MATRQVLTAEQAARAVQIVRELARRGNFSYARVYSEPREGHTRIKWYAVSDRLQREVIVALKKEKIAVELHGGTYGNNHYIGIPSLVIRAPLGFSPRKVPAQV